MIFQTDGNFVLYQNGTALWASNTYAPSNDYGVLQTDGNFVIYTYSGTPIFATHTGGYSNNVLNMQDDGNIVIYAGGSAIWASDTAANLRDCWLYFINNCTRATFADNIVGSPPQSPYNGPDAPQVNVNKYSVNVWENAENTKCAYNPLATTQPEGGNSSNCPYVTCPPCVKQYVNWDIGIQATDQTLLNGLYNPILSVLRNANAINGNYNTCVALAQAVGNTHWGTGNFQADC